MLPVLTRLDSVETWMSLGGSGGFLLMVDCDYDCVAWNRSGQVRLGRVVVVQGLDASEYCERMLARSHPLCPASHYSPRGTGIAAQVSA